LLDVFLKVCSAGFMISFLLISFLTSAKTIDHNPWGKITHPTAHSSAQIYGSYTSGCILGGEALPEEGEGYKVVNTYRNRYYAHSSLTSMIKSWGQWSKEKKLGTLVVGDLSQPAGGPLTGAHRSHQIGLDVDLRLHLLTPGQKIKNRNQFSSTDVVQCKTTKAQKINYQFMPQKWPVSTTQLLQKIASEKNVERLFVSAGIKKYLCAAFPDYPVWLKKIRPEWGHTSHFHVRLRCPEGMDQCQGQPPIPVDVTDTSGVGCSGQDLEYWFKTNKDQKILAGCYPKSQPETQPYWEKVIHSSNFPKECQEVLLPASETSPIVLKDQPTPEA